MMQIIFLAFMLTTSLYIIHESLQAIFLINRALQKMRRENNQFKKISTKRKEKFGGSLSFVSDLEKGELSISESDGNLSINHQ